VPHLTRSADDDARSFGSKVRSEKRSGLPGLEPGVSASGRKVLEYNLTPMSFESKL